MLGEKIVKRRQGMAKSISQQKVLEETMVCEKSSEVLGRSR